MTACTASLGSPVGSTHQSCFKFSKPTDWPLNRLCNLAHSVDTSIAVTCKLTAVSTLQHQFQKLAVHSSCCTRPVPAAPLGRMELNVSHNSGTSTLIYGICYSYSAGPLTSVGDNDGQHRLLELVGTSTADDERLYHLPVQACPQRRHPRETHLQTHRCGCIVHRRASFKALLNASAGLQL